MSSLSEEYRLSMYEVLATIGDHKNIMLVRDQISGRIFVKKELEIYQESIYRALLERTAPESAPSEHITGIPEIILCVQTDSCLVLIEQFINGRTLEELIQNDGIFSDAQAISLGHALCDTLSQLHALNPPVICRDLKPSNILLDPNGQWYIVDFNAARSYDPSRKTDTVCLGTHGYAAPEQYGFGQSDCRTDLYALGAVLQYCLTGQPPESRQTVPETSALAPVISRCMQLDPQTRFHDALELDRAFPASSSAKRKASSSASASAMFPPGFRSHTPWKMILAVLGYLALTDLAFGLETNLTNPASILLEKVSVFLMFLCEIAFYANYRNVQRFVPFLNTPVQKLRIAGLILGGVLIVLGWGLLSVLIQNLFL